ncbi:MAG: hypothetical protein ACXVIJ_03330 [Thermoanaerobaculia bacterium]
MNLRNLRSTPPLRDADFAAIRARVDAQIDEQLCGGGRLARPGAGWFLTFAAAAAAIVIAVLLPHKPAAVPQHPPRVVRAVQVPPPPTVTELLKPPSQPSQMQRVALPHKRRSAPARELRIHLQTADPNIRIIWIVNPKNLKEES